MNRDNGSKRFYQINNEFGYTAKNAETHMSKVFLRSCLKTRKNCNAAILAAVKGGIRAAL